MSEKRFVVEVDENRDVRILDKGIDIGQFRVCNQLNALYEEYLRLKEENEELKKRLGVK